MSALRFVVIIALLSAGCTPVHFTEKRDLSDPIMDLRGDPTESHFHQKAHASREGSVGGIGGGGGGGCGCY